MDGEVHLAFGILEDPELGNLLRQDICLGLGIGLGNTNQEHEALANLTDGNTIYPHLRAGTTLYYYSHDMMKYNRAYSA